MLHWDTVDDLCITHTWQETAVDPVERRSEIVPEDIAVVTTWFMLQGLKILAPYVDHIL